MNDSEQAAPARPDLSRFAWLSIAAAVTTIGLKTAAWAMTGSVGLLSDAAESLVNLVAAFVALIALRVAARPADSDHHFGHSKAEYFSAAIEGMMILVAAGIILFTSAERFVHPVPLEGVGPALVVSVVASIVNASVALVLIRAGRKHNSLTLIADGKHLMTDVWTSVGVIVGVGAVALTGWERLDPVIAFAVGVNIIITGWHLISRSTSGLMDHALPDERVAELTGVLDGFGAEGVNYHELRTRESGYMVFCSAHITMPGNWTVTRAHDVLDRIEQALQERFEHLDVMLHLEPEAENCPSRPQRATVPVVGQEPTANAG